MAHDLCGPPQFLLYPVCSLALSGVARVQPQVRKRQVTIPRGFQQDLDALPVLDLRAVDPGFEHHTLGVHEYVALSAFDLLAAVVAAFFTSHPSCLD
jgi:hypothetical protein